MKQSIPTKYNGTMYRSKTEAQFAYLFDKLGMAFEYEPENFEVGGLGYCPDFHLLGEDIWFEVKGELTQEDYNKICGFHAVTGNTIYIGNIVAGSFQIMDVDENDVTNIIFANVDPFDVSKYMVEALSYDFPEEVKSVNPKAKLISLMVKYIYKLSSGSTFYHWSDDHTYIYNEIFERDNHGNYIKEDYWTKIEVDDTGWFLVTLYRDDEEILSVPTEHEEYVTTLCQRMFRTFYEIKHNDTNELYDEIIQRNLDKAITIATMGKT